MIIADNQQLKKRGLSFYKNMCCGKFIRGLWWFWCLFIRNDQSTRYFSAPQINTHALGSHTRITSLFNCWSLIPMHPTIENDPQLTYFEDINSCQSVYNVTFHVWLQICAYRSEGLIFLPVNTNNSKARNWKLQPSEIPW